MRHSLTRRRFFEGAATLGALAALSGCSPKVAEDENLANTGASPEIETVNFDEYEVKHSWCYMCGPAKALCSTLCYINPEGRWVHVEGNPVAGNNWGYGCKSLCAKGNSAMQTLYNPARIEYPMRRVGEKGEGKFERCTWDEAIEGIATKLQEIKDQYGPETFALWSPQECKFVMQMGRRFLNVFGTPNYMHSAICQTQITSSRELSIGTKADTYPYQLNKTKLLVNWGVNGENADMNNNIDKANPVRRFDAMDNGLQFIDIRPMLDPLATHASVWVPVRPGTDGALALAILNVLVEEDLYDHDFCENWCNGFDKLAEHVKQFPPSWAAPITGIPEERIIEVARLMGTTKPMGINIGNGIGDQSADGHWTVACACLIEAITGNLGIAGGGGAGMVMPEPLIKTKPIDLLSDRLPASEEDTANGWMAGVAKLVGPETPRWFQDMVTQESGPTTAYNKGIQSILSEKPYPLRFIFAQSSNPMSATRQPKTVAEALKKLDYYVVMDVAWNSSCDYADIVLPATTQYESADQFATKNSPAGTFIGINQVISEPVGECRSDWQYYLDLAVKMGYGADFWNGDIDAMLSEQLDGSGVTLEELREKGGIFKERTDGAKPTEPEYQNYEKMFATLPQGKVQCVNEWIGGKPNADDTGTIERLPVYKGAPESLTGTPEIAAEYPLVISDVHAYRLCNHSYYHDVPYLRELQPEPWVKINPATAAQYGIADGDWVLIESPHGSIKMVARFFEAIQPNVLMTKRGWWEPCDELGLPGYGSLDGGSEVNVLYDDTIANYDGFTSAMAKQTLVKISKSEG